jgi:16S rRNA (uracil1498-N3)-methyltransferase
LAKPPRLFVEQDLHADAAVALAKPQAHYLRNVMRLRDGDGVKLFNGRDGEWLGTLAAAGKSSLTVALTRQTRAQTPEAGPRLLFAPIKRGPMEILVQKATELGVAHLQPMLTDYTDVVRFNAARLTATATEAAEQCERLGVPTLGEPAKLADLLDAWPAGERLLFAAESGDAKPIAAALSEFAGQAESAAAANWAIAIGPVGGFSPEEHARLRGLDFVVPVGLGPRLLKAETAAIAALSCWQSLLGDWQGRPPEAS